mgnify:CR=1 FL=1
MRAGGLQVSDWGGGRGGKGPDGAHDQARGACLFAWRPFLPPGSDAEAAFVAEQGDDDEHHEDHENGQRVEDLGGQHGHLIRHVACAWRQGVLWCESVEAEHVEGGLVEALDAPKPRFGT